MWYLISKNDPRVIHLTSCSSKYTIGRSPEQTEFAFPEDSSMSRKHASVTYTEDGPSIIDLGSKYGTFVNQTGNENAEKIKLQPNTPVVLGAGHQVKFGIIANEWVVMKQDFVTCTSTVKGENLQALRSTLLKLGGILKTDWDDTCNFLTMPAITLTIKVVLALAQGSQIVTLEFWNKCCEAVQNKTVLPDPNNFVPQVLESTLNKEVVSFLPNLKRKKLFAGKRFVFFSKRQLQMYEAVLKMTSGVALLLSESKLTKSMLSAPDVIVIQYSINNTSQEFQAQQAQINSIVAYLQSKGKRVIADAEIGLAILYYSTEKYCNPDFNFTSEVMKQNLNSDEHEKKAAVLAPETQDTLSKLNTRDNVIINESLSDTVMDNGVKTSKRKVNEDDDEVEKNAQKKFASGNNSDSKKNDEDEFFNFIEKNDQQIKVEPDTNQRLNFSKPVKRKQEQLGNKDDEDLFNFVPSNENTEGNSNQKIFDDSSAPCSKRQKIQENKRSVSFPSGLSVKELLENSKSWKSSDDIIDVDSYKISNLTDDIEDKINNLDLGTTVVVIKKELIIKKEPLEITSTESTKNFKKFKKVWPLKMQVTIIPKSSMSVVKPDASAIIGDLQQSDTDDDMMAVDAHKFRKGQPKKFTNLKDDGVMLHN